MSAGSPQPGAGQRSLRLTKNGTRHRKIAKAKGAETDALQAQDGQAKIPHMRRIWRLTP